MQRCTNPLNWNLMLWVQLFSFGGSKIGYDLEGLVHARTPRRFAVLMWTEVHHYLSINLPFSLGWNPCAMFISSGTDVWDTSHGFSTSSFLKWQHFHFYIKQRKSLECSLHKRNILFYWFSLFFCKIMAFYYDSQPLKPPVCSRLHI